MGFQEKAMKIAGVTADEEDEDEEDYDGAETPDDDEGELKSL